MSYVITGTCVNDGACVDVCPVDCIHPTPAEPGFLGADMLYIDPDVCVSCNACAEACPVGAVMDEKSLPPELLRYRDINAEFSRLRKDS
ncbi:MAG: NADPH-dependent glutamate synthase beta chain-related oxidoreductase [Hydrocarboniphaga sp.]|nr:4Fe-4S binding protein [Hydrocarboniphaga sp.]MDB5970135.1 NADPH-dependent glutamate synthase beta chain-related oxidoreductase [Hydrocarboniphaga sp.]